MRRSKNRRWLTLPLLALGLAWVLGGCVEYTVETTLNPDGSGLRLERMDVGENEEVDVTSQEFTDLMHVSPRRGWAYSKGTNEDGDSIDVLRRERAVRSLDGWSDLTGQVRISGSLPAEAETRIGYVRLGDILYANEVLVVRGEGSDGSQAFTYRETFSWIDAMDVLVEFFMERVDGILGEKYPRLSNRERGEIVGFARARIWMAIDEGLMEAGNAEEARMVAELAEVTSTQGIKLVRLHYPRESGDFLENALSQLFGDDDAWLDVLVGEKVPGLSLAFNTAMIFRLNMPGRVTSTNAHDRDGSTLTWEFGPTDAIPDKIQIFAQSVVESPGSGPGGPGGGPTP